MRHRNEEDDFIVVKSTGQRVVFVAIIFVAPTHPQSLSATLFFFLFPSCVATLNPTTEVNPKCFFFCVFPLSLLLLLLRLGIRLDSSLFFSLVSAYVLLVEGWFRRDDGGSVSSGALTERERERERIITHAHTYTCENKAIFLFVFLSFRVIGK